MDLPHCGSLFYFILKVPVYMLCVLLLNLLIQAYLVCCTIYLKLRAFTAKTDGLVSLVSLKNCPSSYSNSYRVCCKRKLCKK